MNNIFEVNFDSLVGPTHNYSGLAQDNLPSRQNQNLISSPKQAALQGLQKMKLLADLGLKQAVLPPHQRPLIAALKYFGFTGSDEAILKTAQQQAPRLLSACSSASYMWTANAATTTPSLDTLDKKCHITPANLVSSFHRTIESSETFQLFKTIFNNPNYFTLHPPLFPSASLADEGAANHTRLCPKHAIQGLHFFVYGRSGFPNYPLLSHPPAEPRILTSGQKEIYEEPECTQKYMRTPNKFLTPPEVKRQRFCYPRQTLEASQAIARFHQIPPSHTLFAQQNPDAINAGVFHNDLICTGNENILLYHELAFLDTPKVIANLKSTYHSLYKQDLLCIPVSDSQVSLHEAIKTYFFNSQLITTPNNKVILLTPSNCQQSPSVSAFLNTLLKTTPINEVHSINLQQSLQNGGGPACLRLRVVLTEQELQSLPQSIWITPALYDTLCEWVKRHYRDALYPADLAQIELLRESQKTFTELNEILELPSLT